jgi:hypothetical protein
MNMELNFSASNFSGSNERKPKSDGFELSTKNSPSETNYHMTLVVYAIVAIFCYYIGSFLIVFLRNDLNGAIVSAAPNYDISWRIAFENFPQLLKNIYDSFFGYFTAYSKLYNRSTAFLIPVDIGIKLVSVLYFLLYWIPWDTKRAYKLGFFHEDYPYVSDEYKDDIADLKHKHRSTDIKQEIALQDYAEPDFLSLPIGDPLTEIKPVSLYPQYDLNPYLRAQMLKNNTSSALPAASHAQVANKLTHLPIDDDEDEEDDDDSGILPFSGVHKPLEEMYQKYEKAIYDLIRRRILPGSNILLVGYFSTLFIVDLANPITVVLYILGIMSMFWCMQSFLLIIDYLQYPPE